MTGKVLRYNKRDGVGIIQAEDGNELYVDCSVLLNLEHLDAGDEVSFDLRKLGGTACAYDVTLTLGGEHTDCGVDDCGLCCQHDDRDHGVCPSCGHEEDPGLAIDRAMDSMEDR